MTNDQFVANLLLKVFCTERIITIIGLIIIIIKSVNI